MCSSPYVLTLQDSAAEAGPAVFSVPTPAGERFDTLQVERVAFQSRTEWLWPDHVPLGKVTVIEGAPGSGKSSVAFDLAARVGNRLPWPDGAPSVLPAADVLVISRHDEAGRIAARFNPPAEGGRSLFRFTGFATETPDCDRSGARPVAFPFDLEALDYHLECNTAIGVVIIDPLSDFCDTPKRLAETLHQLNQLAERHRIAVIATVPAHCRIDPQGGLRVSSRWPTEAARCVWSLVPDPDDVTRRLFVAKRTNFCREPDGLAFRLPEGGVAWEPRSAISPIDPLGQLSACERCLQDLLSAGHLPAATLLRLGAEQGFRPKALRAAAKRLGVTSARIGFGGDGHWHWVLPGGGPTAVGATAREALNRTLLVDDGPPSADERGATVSQRHATPAPSGPREKPAADSPALEERPAAEPALAVNPAPSEREADNADRDGSEPAAETIASPDGPAEATRSNRKSCAAEPVVQPAASRRLSRRQRRRDKRRQRPALASGRNGAAGFQSQ